MTEAERCSTSDLSPPTMPPLTGDLPLKHPAVVISVAILIVGYLTIGYEEHLKTAGVLTVRGGAFALVASVISLPIWVWLMLNMIGRPDLFYEPRPSLVNAEAERRRIELVRAAGYALQTVTLVGSATMLLRWIRI